MCAGSELKMSTAANFALEPNLERAQTGPRESWLLFAAIECRRFVAASLDSRAIERCVTLVSRAAQYGFVYVGVSALLKIAWQLSGKEGRC
jgi:hypothetical protein